MMGSVRRRIAYSLSVTLAALAGCGHAGVAPAPTPAAAPTARTDAARASGDITVDVGIGPPELIGLWSAYGMALAVAADKAGHDDFAGELSARLLLADGWKTDRVQNHLHDPYLDTLADVRDAGFMAEYVLAFLTRPGWTISPDHLAALNFTGWKSWAAVHLPKDHEPVTRVSLEMKRGPTPGLHLPTSDQINPARTPCANLQPALERAVADWDREERGLGQLALSVPRPEQVLPALSRVAGDPRARRDGVVFASPTVVELLFDAGFCAVDRGDLGSADKLLRRAVALSPGNANVRGELVQTLIMEKRLDEADAQLEIALELADSPCHAAMLWRKRGYILFDRGKLVDSYRAYAHSLEFDPQSELAHSEMSLIVATLHRAGTYDEKILAPLIEPGSGKLRVLNCPR
jgi:hypothetical protein